MSENTFKTTYGTKVIPKEVLPNIFPYMILCEVPHLQGKASSNKSEKVLLAVLAADIVPQDEVATWIVENKDLK